MARPCLAFSLVEIALAVGICAFAIVAIMGLLSQGIGGFRTVMDRTICAQIAQRVINDAQQADFKVLIDGKTGESADYTFRTPLRYFDEQGNEIIPKSGELTPEQRRAAVYDVNVRIRPRAQMPRPKELKPPEVAQVTVEVAANPGLPAIPIDSTLNLFKPPAGVRVITFSALVGRND